MDAIGRTGDVDTTRGISHLARALGLMSVTDVKIAVLRQQRVWWNGSRYHCPVCEANFANAGSAAAHTIADQHPVLRMD